MVLADDVAALVLAAGLSSRMGTFKPLIVINGRRVIEHVIAGIRDAGIRQILVVAGYQAGRLLRAIEGTGGVGVLNRNYRREMFSSVKIGIANINSACSAFFLIPGDMPFVRSDTYRDLLTAFEPERMDMLRPRYQQKIGHPVLISAAKIPSIKAYEDAGGLRRLARSQNWRMADLDCHDPGILVDLDKPEDLLLT